jgi:hypothetical protein
MSDQFEGGCRCGAVRFVATGLPESVAWYHCQSLSEGAPAVVRSGRRLGTRSKSNTVARVAEHRYVASEEPLRLQSPGYRFTSRPIPG